MGDQDERLWKLGLQIAETLHAHGYDAYLVGGCVRDRMLGRPLNDVDIATSALPDAVMSLFARTIPTGIKHGTVTVMESGLPFEVTTFRTEGGYSDARRPDEITFVTDIREDLSRRDFTINAMAVGLNGSTVDPFGGCGDLEAGVIRCVGDAAERFGEDALRIVRAVRFAAELDFRMAPTVWDGIRCQRERLRHVAMERIGAEWDKMMAGSAPGRACHLLFAGGLPACFKEPLPGALLQAAERYRAEEQSWLLDEGLIAPEMEADVRWAALLIALGASEQVSRDFCRTLRISGRRASRIAAIAGFHERQTASGAAIDRADWIAAVLAYGVPAANDWLAIRGGERFEQLREWLAQMPISAAAELAVKGDELAQWLRKSPGPWVADLLGRLLTDVALGRVPNEKQQLLRAAETANEGESGAANGPSASD